jgi:hypothetical protein
VSNLVAECRAERCDNEVALRLLPPVSLAVESRAEGVAITLRVERMAVWIGEPEWRCAARECVRKPPRVNLQPLVDGVLHGQAPLALSRRPPTPTRMTSEYRAEAGRSLTPAGR